jgi:hypothetical protein
MSTGHQVRHYLGKAVSVPVSQTDAPIAGFAINDAMRLNIKIDVILGVVTGAGTLQLEDSTGFAFWNLIKTATPAASTQKTISAVGVTTGILTSAGHGYTQGQLITLNSTGTVPGGLLPGQRLFVTNPTTNTFQVSLHPANEAPQTSFTDAGSGTITATLATVATLAANVNVAGDQAVMPLRPLGRITATTGGSDTIQVIDVRVCYLY